MVQFPAEFDPNIMSSWDIKTMLSWLDGEPISLYLPHERVIKEFVCTIKRDFIIESTGTAFKKDMEGHLIEEEGKDHGDKVKVFIENVTKHRVNGETVMTQLVPASHVTKGEYMKKSLKEDHDAAQGPSCHGSK